MILRSLGFLTCASLLLAPFASSLQIAAPGPRAAPDGINYSLTLAWASRPGAEAYRVFMWTDAVRGWYKVSQTAVTTANVRAFKSGCTAFVVVAVTAAQSAGNAMSGVDTSNVVRFPLSTKPSLCPAGKP